MAGSVSSSVKWVKSYLLASFTERWWTQLTKWMWKCIKGLEALYKWNMLNIFLIFWQLPLSNFPQSLRITYSVDHVPCSWHKGPISVAPWTQRSGSPLVRQSVVSQTYIQEVTVLFLTLVAEWSRVAPFYKDFLKLVVLRVWSLDWQ